MASPGHTPCASANARTAAPPGHTPCARKTLARAASTTSWNSHLHKSQAFLEVANVTFTVDTPEGKRTLVDSVSFGLQSGDTLAIMGPSGAGKTTLLELMTMKVSGKNASGSVMLNGAPMTGDRFHAHAATCEQFDTHWSFLTCAEIMGYAAKFCTTDHEERKDRVNTIMDHLGLQECASTKAGNAFVKGLSGGQKKRLSLGVALLKGPTVLFLDEPTSGLDAASTEACMRFISDCAVSTKMIVVATIHQPSMEVFMGFTKVLFLANGRIAYLGDPGELRAHCSTIGHPLSESANPAAFFIQLTNSEFVERGQVDAIVAAYAALAAPLPGALTGPAGYDDLSISKRVGWHSQFWTLLRRHGWLCVRDPTLYVGRMFVFLMSNLFFAIIYIKAREREQEYAVARYFLTAWFNTVTSMFSVVVVIASNEEFKLVRKELHDGMFSATPFILSKLVLQIPNMFLLAISALLVPAYLVANFNWDGFVMSNVIMASSIWAFECQGEFFGVALQNPLHGMLFSVMLWFSAFLFSGNFLAPEFVIWPFRIFTYIFPLRWTMRGLVYSETHGTVWKGAELTQNGGFMCPDLPPRQCFGRTGDQVRVSLATQFGNLSAEDTVVTDICYILCVAVFFKIASCALIMYKARGVRPLQPEVADQCERLRNATLLGRTREASGEQKDHPKRVLGDAAQEVCSQDEIV